MVNRQKERLFRQLCRDALLRDGAGLSDHELLERFLARQDEGAFEALVRRHGPMVWGVCRRLLPSHHDAEDAFQATFLVLVRKAASLASRELLANWLYGVAQRTSLRARTAAAKRHARQQPLTDLPDPEAAPGELWDDLRPLLDQELSGLPEKYRVPILLCDLEGRTRAEAARQLGCPEGTVAGRLARARALLARRLARRGVALSVGTLTMVLAEKAGAVSVPGAVIGTTVKAASLLAVGSAATAGLLSSPVAALTEGVVKSMLLHKLKVGVMLVLVAAAVGVGGSGLAYRQLFAADPQQEQTGDGQPAGGRGAAPGAGKVRKPAEALKQDDLLREAQKLREIEELRRELVEIRAREAAAKEKENALLRKELAELKMLMLTQHVENVRLKAELESTRKELTVWEARCRDAEALSRSLKDRLQEWSARVAAPQPKENQKPLPSAVRGVVTEVFPEGYVKISLGSDQGIREGQLLQVFRLKPQAVYLGTLKILAVQPSTALAAGKNAATLVKPGDEVANQLLKGEIDGQKLSTPPLPPRTNPSSKATLQGRWRVIAVEIGGKKVPLGRLLNEPRPSDQVPGVAAEIRFVFNKNTVTIERDDKIKRGTYSVDTTRSPNRIDMHFLVGGGDFEETMTMLGVYAVEGVTLKLSLGTGQRRPLRFGGNLGGPGTSYYILQREPPYATESRGPSPNDAAAGAEETPGAVKADGK